MDIMKDLEIKTNEEVRTIAPCWTPVRRLLKLSFKSYIFNLFISCVFKEIEKRQKQAEVYQIDHELIKSYLHIIKRKNVIHLYTQWTKWYLESTQWSHPEICFREEFTIMIFK